MRSLAGKPSFCNCRIKTRRQVRDRGYALTIGWGGPWQCAGTIALLTAGIKFANSTPDDSNTYARTAYVASTPRRRSTSTSVDMTPNPRLAYHLAIATGKNIAEAWPHVKPVAKPTPIIPAKVDDVKAMFDQPSNIAAEELARHTERLGEVPEMEGLEMKVGRMTVDETGYEGLRDDIGRVSEASARH